MYDYSLLNTPLADGNKRQASHLCGNGDCLLHIYPETAAVNKSRIACHAKRCAADYEHFPRCLHQRDGELLPCRSNATMSECECDRECFRGGWRLIRSFRRQKTRFQSCVLPRRSRRLLKSASLPRRARKRAQRSRRQARRRAASRHSCHKPSRF